MIEDLIKTPQFRKYFPPIAGLVFVGVFVSLAFWQLDRAKEKKALLALFEGDAPYARVSDYATLGEFDRIQVDGEFLSEHQVLIDNIVQNGRPGYFVITPFKPNTVDPLLLVNRGWVPKTGPGDPDVDVVLEDGYRTIRGLVGHLPRVAIRPGEAFTEAEKWPRVAVYPRADEIAAVLGSPVLPILLLLGPDEDDGFARRWQPNQSGPATHYGYAVQWFAMAAMVIALLFWHLRKRASRD
ncbi:MAG: SURF1 family protein [Woeseiaceae bacterium]